VVSGSSMDGGAGAGAGAGAGSGGVVVADGGALLADPVADGSGLADGGALPAGTSVARAEPTVEGTGIGIGIGVDVGVGVGVGAFGGDALTEGLSESEVPVVAGVSAGPPTQPERAKTMPAPASPPSESRIKRFRNTASHSFKHPRRPLRPLPTYEGLAHPIQHSGVAVGPIPECRSVLRRGCRARLVRRPDGSGGACRGIRQV
jgi:hypothetical protein